MRFFPLFTDLQGASVLVVGGGEQAAQKVRLLLRTAARITLVAPQANDELAQLAREGRVELAKRPFLESDLAGRRLVYVATGDLAQDRAVSAAAQAGAIPVNVVDRPDLSTFITPAIVDRAPVTVAIGTEGAAPILAREIKTRLEAWLPANFGHLARHAQALRDDMAKRFPETRTRRRVWERLLAGAFRRAAIESTIKGRAAT